MERFYLLIGIVLLTNTSLIALDFENSAKRPENEDYRITAQKHLSLNKLGKSDTFAGQDQDEADKTAYQLKKKLSQLTFDHLFEINDYNELLDMFRELRDQRFLVESTRSEFLRRLTWLYPDDGCFERAKIMNNQLYKSNKKPLHTIFIFGNLKVDTNNHPSGAVTWWYHVAPIVKHNNEVYVVDPAINHYRPLLLKDWIAAQTNFLTGDDAQLSICNFNTFTPSTQGCAKSVEYNNNISFSGINYYLSAEWERQIILEREPKLVLGDDPIWEAETQDEQRVN